MWAAIDQRSQPLSLKISSPREKKYQYFVKQFFEKPTELRISNRPKYPGLVRVSCYTCVLITNYALLATKWIYLLYQNSVSAETDDILKSVRKMLLSHWLSVESLGADKKHQCRIKTTASQL